MKRPLFLLALLLQCSAMFAQVAINNDGSMPDPSAGLDVNYTDKGLLIPRISLVNTTSALPVTSPAASLLVYNTAATADVSPGYYYWSGTAWVKLNATAGGSGTINYVTKWTADGTLGNSQLFDDGTNVGIGTATPEATLDVLGTVRITDGTHGADKVLTSDANGLASWQVSELTELASIPPTAGCYLLTGSVSTGEYSYPQSVAVSGNYAYVANTGGSTLAVFDVSTQASPSQLGSVSTGENSLPYSVAVSDNYAYVANYNSHTLAVIDVSSPSLPILVGSLSTGENSYPISVAVSGNYAYVTNYFGYTLAVIDVSTPVSPSQVGSVSTGEISFPISVAVTGNYAYVANVGSSTLAVFDVSNPSFPILVGSVSTGENSSPYSVAVSGNYAYVANYSSHTLAVIDVSTPSLPILVGSVSTGENSYPISVAVSGNSAYVANYNSHTLAVIDVSTPSLPILVESVSTGENSYPISLAVSGNYAYVVNYFSHNMQVMQVKCFSQNILIQDGEVVLVPPIWSASDNNIYNTNTGNVGIGTTSPTEKLTIFTGINTDVKASLVAGGENKQSILCLGTPYQGLLTNPFKTAIIAEGITNWSRAKLHFCLDNTESNDKSNDASVSDAKMTILADGNVGIGTTTPSARLDVIGNVKITDGTHGINKILTSDANGLASWQTPALGGGWSLLGNAGTVPGTNFIGTIDNMALDIRTNNVLRTSITTKGAIEIYNTGQSVFIGEGAGTNDDTTSNKNVFVGYQAGKSNITGYYNVANGFQALYSNTEGYANTANGWRALYGNTTGLYNTANGSFTLYSNTEGSINIANGCWALSSNTTGNYNTANGWSALSSNTSGNSNTAIGFSADVASSDLSNATAIGANAIAGASNSLVLGNNAYVGIGTSTPNAKLHVNEGNFLVSGAYGGGDNIPASGVGTRMFFYPKKAAFRAGFVNSTEWDDENIGLFSTALGYGTTANGYYSIATGYGSTASGFYSTAMGRETTANGDCSTAMGLYTTASGYYSTALGLYTFASGYYSTALGNYTTASGDNSTAVGERTFAKSGYETVVGRWNSDYTPVSTADWDANDRLFSIGNGTASDNRSDAMTVLKNGNVGIGTTSPNAKLQVTNGAIMPSMGNLSTSGILFPENPGGGSGDIAFIRYYISSGENTKLEIANNNDLNDVISFTQSNAERMTIYNGNVGIGTATPSTRLDVVGTIKAQEFKAHDEIGFKFFDNNGAGYLKIANAGGTWIGSYASEGNLSPIIFDSNIGIGTSSPSEKLDVNGNARFRNIGSGASVGAVHRTSDGTLTTSTSDIRLKTNIETINNGLERVMKLRGVTFNWKEYPDNSKMIGFIAQEVEQAVPEIVFTNQVDGYMGVNYGEMTAVLVEAVKQQQNMIEELSNQNQDLKSANEALNKKLESMQAQIEVINGYLGVSSVK